jgi:hypothetical protein
VHIPNLWRAATIGTVACGVAAAGAGPAIGQPTAAPTISITAKSPFKPVTHDVFVSYKAGKYGNVALTGKISGATAGQVADLYAQQFPFTKAAVPVAGQTLALTGISPVSYRFTATPTLATRYTVKVLPSSTSTTPVASSAATTVYVLSTQPYFGGRSCNTRGNRPVCHQTWRVYTHLPASAYRIEHAKKWYVYFGLRLSPVNEPPLPKWMYLDTKAKVSKARFISSAEFERTISLSFRIGNDGYHFAWYSCSKDTESKDGLNLPGHHGCGIKKVRSNVNYLG